MDVIWNWVEEHSGWVTAAGITMAVVSVAGLLSLPAVIGRIPSEWLVRAGEARPLSVGRVLRNLLGWALVLAGIAMLVLPGQGVLTIAIGLLLADFPGKRAAMARLLAMPRVQRTINRFRRRAGREPIHLETRATRRTVVHHGPEREPDHDGEPVEKLRLVTWNVQKGWSVRRGRVDAERFAEVLEPRCPDVVLWQEAFRAEDLIEAHLVRSVGDFFDMPRVYGPNAFYRSGDHGNATLSRYPITRVDNRDLSTNPIEHRGLLYTRLHLPGTEVHVFNTHLGLNTVQRRRQIARIAKVIEELCPSDVPVVLAGDFNDWTGQLDALVQDRCGLSSALTDLPPRLRRTWPSGRPVFWLDRIYYRNLELLGTTILDEPPLPTLSDHLPIEVEFRIPRNSKAEDEKS